MATNLDEALACVRDASRAGEALSGGLVSNCAEVLPELVARGVIPDVVTDQTSAHDPLGRLIPAGMSLARAEWLRDHDPDEYVRRSLSSMRAHCEAIVAMQEAGAVAPSSGAAACPGSRRLRSASLLRQEGTFLLRYDTRSPPTNLTCSWFRFT